MASPLIAKELQASFRQAITDAKSMRHEYLTLEHLLLALTRESKTQKILVACGANVKRLRQRLEKFLAETVDRLPSSVSAEPQQPSASSGCKSGAFLVQAEVSRDIWNALVRYRGERKVELGREYSMSEALNVLLAKALGLEPPSEWAAREAMP